MGVPYVGAIPQAPAPKPLTNALRIMFTIGKRAQLVSIEVLPMAEITKGHIKGSEVFSRAIRTVHGHYDFEKQH